MNPFDKLISLIAPHRCGSCGVHGTLLCNDCIKNYHDPIAGRCAGCKTLNEGFKTCKSCKSWLSPYVVYVSAAYEGVYKELVHSLKFEHKRQAAEPIAEIIKSGLDNLPEDTIIVPIPTAPKRIRQRGFDHAVLISRYLFRKTGLPMRQVLRRDSNVRQLGSSRAERLRHMENIFTIPHPEQIAGKNVLLVDDVFTTGATISAAGNVLKKAGAKRVYAAIFCQKID